MGFPTALPFFNLTATLKYFWPLLGLLFKMTIVHRPWYFPWHSFRLCQGCGSKPNSGFHGGCSCNSSQCSPTKAPPESRPEWLHIHFRLYVQDIMFIFSYIASLMPGWFFFAMPHLSMYFDYISEARPHIISAASQINKPLAFLADSQPRSVPCRV